MKGGLAAVTAVMGAPARSAMLSALLDGRALTATELALEADVSASTASSHLSKLVQAGLVSLAQQGRHRYFRLASAEVATTLERLAGLMPPTTPRQVGPRDEGLRRARACYDHLAGELSTTWLERMRERELLRGGNSLAVTAGGERWFARLGVELEPLRGGSRPLLLGCLDWSERRDHLAGALGAALLQRLLQLRLVKRVPASRALVVSTAGAALLTRLQLPG